MFFFFFFFFLRRYTRERCSSYSSEFRGSVWHRLNLADNATARNKKTESSRLENKRRLFSRPEARNVSLRVEKNIRTQSRSKNWAFVRRLVYRRCNNIARENRCKSDRDFNKSRRCIPELLVRSARAWIHAACGYNKSVET